LAIGGLNGILKAVAGVVTTALVNLSSDVTGILGVANGGTGTSTAPTYGQVLVGNASGGYTLTATSSLGISGPASVAWGNITGTLANQTDLQSALNLKLGSSSLSAAAPLTYNASTGAFSITQAGAGANGYLSSSDWMNFNGKLGSSTIASLSPNYDAMWNGSAFVNGALFDNGTDIGIGTTSAAVLLTVDATSTTGTIIRISNGSAGGHAYDFLETGSANTGGAGRLDFFDHTTGVARLSIAANGNIGVGTTSPFTTFAVNGSGYFTGNLITTGTLSGLTVSGQGNGLYSVPVTLGATLHTFGDSITYGTGATSRTVDYVSLLSADMNAGLTDYGISGEQACDMGDSEVFPNENPASTTRNMIYTVMIGTNDAEVKGVGSYESVFNTCEQAEIAWLAIPSQYKVFGQSSGNTTTGTWANDNTYQTGIGIQSTTNGSTLAVPITTTSGPVYIWYRIQDGNAGTFSYNIDGGSNVSANAFTSPTIATQNGGTRSVALARITGVSAGTHTINFTVTSATGAGNIVSILAVGTTAIASYQAPKVFVGGVLRQQNDNISATTAEYNLDVANNVSLLAGDGLAVYFVNVRNYANSTTDMYDGYHPNNAGHSHLRDAFEAVMQFVPLTTYANAGGFTLAVGAPQAETWMSGTSSAYYSIAIGQNALATAPTGAMSQGRFNVAIGGSALSNNTTGNYNTALNNSSLGSNTSGSGDIAIGLGSLAQNTTANSNVAIGNNALAYTQTGSNNTVVGASAGQGVSNSSFSNNSLFGTNVGAALSTGSRNIFLGYDVASTSATGNNNIALGYDIALPSTNGSNQLDIGNLIFGTGINGEGPNLSTGNIGIGTTTPYSRLTLWGTDTASSTAALTIANSASTTEFAVFDGGNAQLAGTLTQNSDQRLKTNIQSLDASSSLAAIDALNPVTFNWIDPTEGTTPQLGFIAQQVQQLFPALISTTSPTPLTPNGTLGLNYIGLIAPIVEAIQTLSADLSALTGRVSSLEAAVAGFANSFHTQQLCVGSTCINQQQLSGLLALEQQGQVQISAPTPPTISGTTTPPSINIQGNNPATINVGDTYTDLGAIVTDNQGRSLGYKTFLDGALVSNILIDTSQVATDTIDYVATDTWGNTATSTRAVVIEESPSFIPTNEASTTASSSPSVQ
jgi:hypothetical protein